MAESLAENPGRRKRRERLGEIAWFRRLPSRGYYDARKVAADVNPWRGYVEQGVSRNEASERSAELRFGAMNGADE